jgi:hypothetical protein
MKRIGRRVYHVIAAVAMGVLLGVSPLLLSGLDLQAQEPTPILPKGTDSRVVEAKSIITDTLGNPPPAQTDIDGEPMFFSAAKSTYGKHAKSLRWRVYPPERAERAQFFDEGRVLCLGKGQTPITLTVQLITALSDTADSSEITIQIGKKIDPTPDPKPNPNPTPGPTPKPDDKIDLPDALLAICQKAPKENRQEIAVILEEVANSRQSSVSDFKMLTREKANTKLGSKFYPWVPWCDDLFDYIDEQKMGDPARLSQTWKAVAKWLVST